MINVSNIERFATHDGPGIRTTIFLKGCPLHCPWCANPETWSVQPVLMHNESKCVRCQRCKALCLPQAITFTPAFHLDANKCNACKECVNTCLNNALSIVGEAMCIKDILAEIKKDDAYYQTSNGGITLSGGEPLYQKEVLALLKALKQAQYHVAVETTGQYPLAWLKQVEPYIDLFLFDVKHIDEIKLKQVIGADLSLIRNNLAYLSKHCANKVIIRTPVIYNFNDEETVLLSIIKQTKEYGFCEIDLLPYHSLGKNKWHDLKKTYAYEDEKMMDKEELIKYKQYGEKIHLTVKIGG
ncbi:MAG: glycyl-radical enzyme activating protein [Erysipelotrichia bacterium]|nr:glycyl-radical enzyme activating protein [Erysipelotrichia bacterium]